MSDLATYAIEGLELGIEPGTQRLVRDLKVFRVGTFRDSKGRRRTWTADELTDAASNFRMLKDKGVLVNVPMRIDHTRSAKDICGYIMDLRFDGHFLLADVQFTDSHWYSKYEEGTLRSRSLEIGGYRDNDENVYSSVVQGLAWTDYPAVEGLYTRHTDEGADMTKPNGEQQGTETPAETPPAETPPAQTPEQSPAQTPPEQPAQPAQTPPEQPPAAPAETPPQTPPGQAQEPAQHSANLEVHTFTLGGQAVSDFSAVQAEIDRLEKFEKDMRDLGRTAYVKDLADDGRILATQVETFSKMTLDMSDAQFATFQAAYDQAPKNPLLTKHSFGAGTPAAVLDAKAKETRIADLQAVISTHKIRGTSQEDIEKMPSWTELQSLTKEN